MIREYIQTRLGRRWTAGDEGPVTGAGAGRGLSKRRSARSWACKKSPAQRRGFRSTSSFRTTGWFAVSSCGARLSDSIRAAHRHVASSRAS